jgi:hypothetical protein
MLLKAKSTASGCIARHSHHEQPHLLLLALHLLNNGEKPHSTLALAIAPGRFQNGLLAKWPCTDYSG